MNIDKLVKKAGKGDKDAMVQLVLERKHEYYKLAYIIYTENKEDSLDALSEEKKERSPVW